MLLCRLSSEVLQAYDFECDECNVQAVKRVLALDHDPDEVRPRFQAGARLCACGVES